MQNLKLKIGDKAPDFRLPGADGKMYSLNNFKGKKALVIIFMCNHCPYVQGSLERIKAIQNEFGIKSVQVVGINSNDEINYPDDSFEKMIEINKEKRLNFPYLRDENQAVASAYGAQCTPECFVFDEKRALKYHGRIDNSPKEPSAVQTTDLRNAIEALIHNKKIVVELTPAIGCSIKWK
ncbi:thioredoxin family protein [Candidatus Woesearchaeota archaeon]|nr:thioredoxin family protein [Candidatus Woesearchaeota archaeon]